MIVREASVLILTLFWPGADRVQSNIEFTDDPILAIYIFVPLGHATKRYVRYDLKTLNK